VVYFAQLLTQKAYPLRLPREYSDDIQRHISQHQTTTRERAPFRRQLDFWAFSITTAMAHDLAPRDQPSAKWGRKFVDTREVTIPETLADLLAVTAFHHLGYEHEGIDDPAQVIEINNRLAGAGCPVVLEHLNSSDLRLTPLDKALNHAASMLQDISRS